MLTIQQIDRDPSCPSRIPDRYSIIINRVLNTGGTLEEARVELAALPCSECGVVDCRNACAK